MLNFAEELYLLALDDRQGEVIHTSLKVFDQVLAGALLMDLALRNRLDADVAELRLVDGAATGDPLLDETLAELQRDSRPRATADWLQRLARPERDLSGRVLARLLARGILRQEDRRLFWVFAIRQYPLIDDREIREVKTRLRELILSDELPDPRDVVLISLASSANLFDAVFTPEEFARVRERIAMLARLDLIGQAVARSVREIEQTMTQTMIVAMATLNS